MIKTVSIALLAATFLPAAALAKNWEMNITATTALQGKNKLSFGQKSNATDGFDGAYESPAYLEGGIKAYFPHPEWTDEPARNYWRDIRADDGEKSWILRVEPTRANETITLSWKSANVPSGYSATLTDDLTDHAVDMTKTGSYVYTSSDYREFTLTFMVKLSDTLDSDGDGITDAVEIQIGTNPNVANSAPAQVKIKTANGKVFSPSDSIKVDFDASSDPEGMAVSYVVSLYEGMGNNRTHLETVTVDSAAGYVPGVALKENTIYTVVIKATDSYAESDVTETSFVASSGTVEGDSDYSGAVDGYDLLLISVVFGKSSTDENFNPYADLNKDNIIDGSDIALLALNFGARKGK